MGSLLGLMVLAQQAGGVICIQPLAPAADFATAGKGASDGNFDDSPEARKARVEAASKRGPVIYAVGERASLPVTDTQAACLEGLPLEAAQQLKANGRPLFSFTISNAEPVRWLRGSVFYGSKSLDVVPERLRCPKRSPTPDCSWCPCRSIQYLPPDAGTR